MAGGTEGSSMDSESEISKETRSHQERAGSSVITVPKKKVLSRRAKKEKPKKRAAAPTPAVPLNRGKNFRTHFKLEPYAKDQKGRERTSQCD